MRPLAKSKKKHPGGKLLVENRRARFEYHILEEIEAGISLVGSEVKSIRESQVSLTEAFCQFNGDELFLLQAHVAEYPLAHRRNHEPLRPRKLLLHRKQLDRLARATKLDGVTIVPMSMYIKDRRIKIVIGVGKGKKMHDKRASMKERDQKREMQRALREKS